MMAKMSGIATPGCRRFGMRVVMLHQVGVRHMWRAGVAAGHWGKSIA